MASKIKKNPIFVDGPQIGVKKVYPSVYAVTSLLNLSRAICHGYFSTK